MKEDEPCIRPCSSKCNKKKPCSHICQRGCHPNSCYEEPCKTLVRVVCKCGNLENWLECGCTD